MLTTYPVPGKDKSKLICEAFRYGVPRNAEGAVFFGTEGQMDAFQAAKKSGKPWYYVDNAYFDKHRGIYFRVTKNALQCSGFGKSNGERFKKLGVKIKPWRTEEELGQTILVCPQSDNFMKSTLGRKGDWAAETVAKLKAWNIPYRIRVRPWTSDKVKAGIALLDDLKNLRLLITHSSAAAITAILEGVPAISETGAAHDITGPLLSASVLEPVRYENRLGFAQVLADNMFTLSEFRDGTAWKWLHR